MKLSINKSRSLWWTISAAIILAGIISMVISWQNPNIKAPLRPSLDFVGGTRLQFERDCTKPGNCDKPIDINVVREVAKAQGIGDSGIQIVADKDTKAENGIINSHKKLKYRSANPVAKCLKRKNWCFRPAKKSN